MTASKNLLSAAVPPATSSLAEAVDFDGVSDYLSRTSDLVGNINTQQVTLSFWVYMPTGASWGVIYAGGYSTYYGLNVYTNGGYVNIEGARETFGSGIFAWSSPALARDTWHHILVSFDLSNSANKYSYINDIADGYFTTYTTGYNLFTAQAKHWVGRQNSPTYYDKGRLSHLYLDHTYRDLSIEANRRLFVTADLKPAAGQAALNPILYLPMDDPTQPGRNDGTGGDFTLTGTVARSGRGPNQYNAPYSDLDGSADYINRTTLLTGIADSKLFTLGFCFSPTNVGVTNKFPITFFSSTSKRLRVIVDYDGSFTIEANNSAGTGVLYVQVAAGFLKNNRNYHAVISVDLADTNNRHLYVNGVSVAATWYTYTDSAIDFAMSTPRYSVGYNDSPATYYDGSIGNVWFNTSYIDLSNPDNLAKFVTGTGIDAKPVDLGANGELPTGTAPIIYLPMYGNNAGKNYGTGGNFTVNSGPFTGARGPNEFWIGSAGGNTSSNYLKRTSILNYSNTNKFVFAASIKGIGHVLYFKSPTAGYEFFRVSVETNYVKIGICNSTYTGYQYWNEYNFTMDTAVWNSMIIASNGGIPVLYWNGVARSVTNSSGTMGTMYLNNSTDIRTAETNYVGALYFSTGTYVDITQEANRLKFFDAFNYPVDLTIAIDSGDIPTPLIHMKFDSNNIGQNFGVGGDFSSVGTITVGPNVGA